MMEFVLSRTVLCACGAIMLIVAAGTAGGLYDLERDDADGELAEDIASLLDSFASSGTDGLILDGSSILPDGYHLTVCDHVVELRGADVSYMAFTSYGGSFELSSSDTITIGPRMSLRSL